MLFRSVAVLGGEHLLGLRAHGGIGGRAGVLVHRQLLASQARLGNAEGVGELRHGVGPGVVAADIGIVGSLDPVAIDKASLDFIYNSDDSGRDHFIERVESRHGIRTIEHAEELGIGTTNYKIIEM